MDPLSGRGEAGDAVLFQVLRSRLAGIVQEMQASLFRSGYSTVVRETQDASCALLDTSGRVVAQHVVLPLHIGAFPACARAVLDHFGEEIAPGDAFLMNDPHSGGSPHAPDFAVLVPIFEGPRRIGFAASMAHKSDIGGAVPGSCWNSATDVYSEGLQLPAVRCELGGAPVPEIERLLAANSRTPRLVLGDLRAQRGAAHLGGMRLGEVVGRYGLDALLWFFDEVIALSRRRIEEVVRSWPDGIAEAVRLVDEDGVVADRPLAVRVRVTVANHRVGFDFTGSDPQSEGPANVRLPLVVAACAYCVLALAGGEPYVNSGLLDAFDVVCEPGSLLDARHPAPVNTYNPTIHAVVDACFAALGQIVAAGSRADGCASRSIVMKADGDRAVQYEVFGGGAGGHAGGDGLSGATVDHSNCRIAPVEIVETEYPIRVLETALLADSAGPGRFRGGLGFRRRYELLQPTQISLRSTRHTIRPAGCGGGAPGRAGRATLRSGDGSELVLRPRCSGIGGRPGDQLVLDTPGGGGLGDPFERDVARVVDDVESGYCSARSAARDYGVVVVIREDGTAAVDHDATARVRTARRDEHGRSAGARPRADG
ncbi:MAG TPA: hydantoinase B/oxoprolinase family protein [Acidimicrobiales bacterium]|nr:hydantoinase B/oxoprolinase family protein [Acidimicrobiales bacterium]